MKRYKPDGTVEDVLTNPIFNDLSVAPKYMEAMPEGVAFAVFAVPAADGSTPRLVLVNPSLIATTEQVLEEIVDRVGAARQELVDANNARDQLQSEQITAIQTMDTALAQLIQANTVRDQALAVVVQKNTDQDAALKVVVDKNVLLDQTQTGQIASIQGLQANMQAVLDQLSARKTVVALPDVVLTTTELVTLLATEKTFVKACAGIKTTDTLIVVPKNMPVGYGLRSWTMPAADQLSLKVQCPILSVAGSGTPVTFGVTAIR